jgi:hypothetical protein
VRICARCGGFMCTDCSQGIAERCPTCRARGSNADDEAAALAWVGQRARTTRVLLGTTGVLCAIPVYGLMYISLREQMLDTNGVNIPIVTSAVSAVIAAVPVAAAFWAGRWLVRLRAPGWVASAAKRFGVDGSALNDLITFIK